MTLKQNKIRVISKQIKMIEERIKSIEVHNTAETFDEVNELYKEKIFLQLLKKDLEEGTHLVKIDSLQKRIEVLCSKFLEAKNRYERAKLLQDHRIMRREMRRMKISRYKMRKLQLSVDYLDNMDYKRTTKSL